MALSAFTGLFGSGKSALASMMAVEEAEGRGSPLWANFSLHGSIPVVRIQDLYDCWDGVIVLDEAQGTAHSRTALQNGEFLEWFDQCRKQGSELLICTQALGKLDKNIREMFNYEFNCHDLGEDYSRVVIYEPEIGRRISQFVYDRSASFGLYNHRERAWPLLGSTKEELQARKVEQAEERLARYGLAASAAPGAQQGAAGVQVSRPKQRLRIGGAR